MRYSESTGCFYPDELNYDSLPKDLIEVSADDYFRAMKRSPGDKLNVQNGMLTVTQAPPPTMAEMLENAKKSQSFAIKSACASDITGGFSSDALGSQHTYPSDQTDQANLSANVLSSFYPALPAGWTTLQLCADDAGVWEYRPHTAAQIQKVGLDGKAAILSCLTKNAQLQAQIQAATDEASVKAIKWS